LARALRALSVAAGLAALLAGAPVTAAPVVLRSPSWAELSPADQQVLAPLASDWDKFDAQRKQKWLGIAKRYPKLAPTEQRRIQQQMRAWAQLTPAQRQAARERYRSIKRLPPEKRREVEEKWQEYQRLPPEKRRELASRAPAPARPRPAPTLPGPTAPASAGK
jgi:Protein of unknown function (DUF3106)